MHRVVSVPRRRSPGVSARRRRVLRLFGWGLAILLNATAAPGQKPRVETFNVGSGLPSPAIVDLARDSSGRLWILGPGGIVVYDGRSFTPASGAGLPDVELGALEVDAGGQFWTMTRWRGPVVYRLDGRQWRALPAPGAGTTNARGWTALAVVRRGTRSAVAVGSSFDGLWLFDGATWAHSDATSGLPSDTVAALAAHGGAVAVGTRGGLCLAEGHELDCRLAGREPRLAESILGLRSDAAGDRLWILAAGWLGYLEGGQLQLVLDDLRLPSIVTTTRGSILADAVGGVYFGVQPQLYFLAPDRRRIARLGLAEGLATEGVTSLLLDRESNPWVASLRGLSKIETQRFLSFDKSLGLLEDEVTAVVEPGPGRLILGHNLGLTFLDADGAETLAFPRSPTDSLDAYRVMDMALDRDGSLWLAAHERGLLRLGRDRTLEARSPAPRAYSVELDAEGRLWACGLKRLFVSSGEGFTEVEHGHGDLNSLRWIAAGPGGGVYVSTARGLLWNEGDAWRLARGPTSEVNMLYGLLPRSKNEVWVGSRAGLYRLRGSELVEVRDGALRIDRPVYFILEDGRGRLWFGTDDGVRVWDGHELRHLSVRHGLAGFETNRSAGLVDHRGRVWIGTDRGVSVYQEAYDTPPAVAPRVEIRSVEVDGRERPLGGQVALSHRQNTLVFHVDTVAFSRQEAVRYRFRLDGFEEEWQGPSALPPAGIRYTNVPPGSYRLRIAAGWAGGSWSGEVTSAPIVIARPFWRRAWFYALTAAAAALAVLGVHGLRTRAIRARNRELEAFNRELSEQIEQRRRAEADREHLITDLEAKNEELERFTYTVSHDLKSPLVTIKGFLGLLEKDAAAGDAERMRRDVERIGAAAQTMGRLLEELLELSRVGRLVNPPEPVAMGELAREAASLVGGEIAERGARVEVAEDLPVVQGDRVRLLEVLQNLIDNAVKFAGAGASPRVEVGAREDGEEVVFYVRDNGVGIDPHYHEKIFDLFDRLDHQVEGTGVGLTLVRRIVEVHGGRIWVESEGEGYGSTFCFTLPGEAPEPGHAA